MFLGIFSPNWVADDEVRLLAAVLVTLFFWRPVGSFVQQFITTKPATPRQIQSGIDAANELLSNFETASQRTVTPLGRLFNSGILHVISGSLLAYLVASLLAMPFGIKFGDL